MTEPHRCCVDGRSRKPSELPGQPAKCCVNRVLGSTEQVVINAVDIGATQHRVLSLANEIDAHAVVQDSRVSRNLFEHFADSPTAKDDVTENVQGAWIVLLGHVQADDFVTGLVDRIAPETLDRGSSNAAVGRLRESPIQSRSHESRRGRDATGRQVIQHVADYGGGDGRFAWHHRSRAWHLRSTCASPKTHSLPREEDQLNPRLPETLMKYASRSLLLALIAAPNLARSQASVPAPERGAYLTIFRSPSSGIELRSGHAAVNLGFYPTVIGRDGKRGNANFIRLGGSYYLKDRGPSLYASPSILFSLDKNWKHGALTELGYRGSIYRQLNGRLGAGVLTTIDGLVRVNPTVGLDIKLGGGR